jgi:hypothetical protein
MFAGNKTRLLIHFPLALLMITGQCHSSALLSKENEFHFSVSSCSKRRLTVAGALFRCYIIL